MTTATLTPAAPAPTRTGVRDALALVGRSLRRSTRQLDTVLISLLLPVILLLLFVYVFGGAMDASGRYVDFVVPGIVMLTAGYGAAGTAVDVATDATGGVVDRFRSMPIRATGVLTGHVVASVVKNAVSTALVVAAAFLVGFDGGGSAGAWLAAAGVVGLWVLAMTWVAVAIGLVASGPEAASGFTFAILFVPYVSSAFVPPETMPAVLETIARFNPVTPVTDTVRGLLLGTPVGTGTWVAALACSVGILVVGRLAAAALFRRAR